MRFKKTGWLTKKVLLLLLVVMVTACSEGANEQEIMERAKGYLAARDLSAATLELKNILQVNALNPEARYLLGKINLEMGDTKTAQKELNRALDAGWDEAAVQLLLAEVLFRQRYFQKVLDDIKIKDSYPDVVKADLIGIWAASEAGLGKWDEAKQTIKQGESITTDSLWLLQSKVRLSIYSKELQAAEQILEYAIKVFPDDQDLWLLSAGLAEENKDFTSASNALQKVIDLDPPKNITIRGRQARLALCHILVEQDDETKAQALIDPVLKTNPGDPLANYMAAKIAFKQEKHDLTEERLHAVLKVTSDHQPSLQLFGALNYARNDFQQAVYYLEKAAALQPDDMGAQVLLGRAYLMLEQYEQAESRLEFASSNISNNAELLTLLGLSKLRGGNKQAGILELEKSAAAAPGNTVIHNELAKAYMAAGETEKAIKELESLLGEGEQQDRTRSLLLLANLQAGSFDKVLEMIAKLSKQSNDDPSPHNLAGVVHEARQDYLSAKSSYQVALNLAPKNSMALIGMARLDLHNGNVDVARQRYETILKTEPDNPQALLGLAKIIGQKGETDDAIQLVEKARIKNPKALEPRLFIAEYYLQINNPAEAQVLAQEAAEIISARETSGFKPFNSRVQALLGRAQLGIGDGRDALITLTILVEHKPGWASAHYYLSQAQVYNEDFLGAQKSLDTALQLDADYVSAKLALGYLKLRTGDTRHALKIARNLQKLQKGKADAFQLEGDIFMSNNNLAQATIAYQKSFDLVPRSNTVLKLYAAKIRAGNTEDASLILKKWLEANPQDRIIRQLMASDYMTNGDIDRAILEYERVIEQYPDSGEALNNLAMLYYQEKNEKHRALGLAKKAYQLIPDNAVVLDTYGWLLLETGSLEQGIWLLHKASAASTDNSIHYHLAVALNRTGDKDAAIEKLKSILKNGDAFLEAEKARALLNVLM